MAVNAVLAPLSSSSRPLGNRAFLDFSPNGQYLAARFRTRAGMQVAVWDLDAAKPVLPRSVGGAWWYDGGLDFSPDRRRVVFSNKDNSLAIHDLAGAQPVNSIPSKEPLFWLAFSPLGGQLAAVQRAIDDDPSQVLIIDLESRTAKQKLNHPRAVSCVAWSPDGVSLATACHDQNVYIWNVAAGQTRFVCGGHRGKVVHVAYNTAGDPARLQRLGHGHNAVGSPHRTKAPADGDALHGLQPRWQKTIHCRGT